jgi:hypothetical protein
LTAGSAGRLDGGQPLDPACPRPPGHPKVTGGATIGLHHTHLMASGPDARCAMVQGPDGSLLEPFLPDPARVRADLAGSGCFATITLP